MSQCFQKVPVKVTDAVPPLKVLKGTWQLPMPKVMAAGGVVVLLEAKLVEFPPVEGALPA